MTQWIGYTLDGVKCFQFNGSDGTKNDKKTPTEVSSPHIYASFDTFCVQVRLKFEPQWVFKLSKEFEIDDIFLRKQRFVDVQAFFKDSLCLE